MVLGSVFKLAAKGAAIGGISFCVYLSSKVNEIWPTSYNGIIDKIFSSNENSKNDTDVENEMQPIERKTENEKVKDLKFRISDLEVHY